MEKAIEVLMQEHRLIEAVLGSLETYAEAVRAEQALQREVVGDYAAFFAGFADACHHGKEEDILFQLMQKHGMPREKGPLAVMYAEHDLCRGHVRTLAALGSSTDAVDHTDGLALVACASEYTALLT